jgi:hypothetical protein
MTTHNFKKLLSEKPCDESGDKMIITKAPAGLYFSSPCFLSEFEEEDDWFKI